jgi:hypothetical protein
MKYQVNFLQFNFIILFGESSGSFSVTKILNLALLEICMLMVVILSLHVTEFLQLEV